MMTPQSDPIRRNPDGSIQFGFYARRAITLRTAERREAPRRWLVALKRLLLRRN